MSLVTPRFGSAPTPSMKRLTADSEVATVSGHGRRRVVSNVEKSYHTLLGVRRILDGISFSVGPGEKIAVLGRNGAGKSTLVKIIGGVETPTRGAIHRGMFQSWPIAFGGGF